MLTIVINENENMHEMIKEEESTLRRWFSSIIQWSPNQISWERDYWICIHGIPLHAWREYLFKLITIIGSQPYRAMVWNLPLTHHLTIYFLINNHVFWHKKSIKSTHSIPTSIKPSESTSIVRNIYQVHFLDEVPKSLHFASPTSHPNPNPFLLTIDIIKVSPQAPLTLVSASFHY